MRGQVACSLLHREVTAFPYLFGLFMPNGMSISFEMQPLLLREQKRKCLCEFCTRDPMQYVLTWCIAREAAINPISLD